MWWASLGSDCKSNWSTCMWTFREVDCLQLQHFIYEIHRNLEASMRDSCGIICKPFKYENTGHALQNLKNIDMNNLMLSIHYILNPLMFYINWIIGKDVQSQMGTGRWLINCTFNYWCATTAFISAFTLSITFIGTETTQGQISTRWRVTDFLHCNGHTLLFICSSINSWDISWYGN